MPGKIFKRREAAQEPAPTTSTPNPTATNSNQAAQDAMKSAQSERPPAPGSVYKDALKDAKPHVAEVDHRYDLPPAEKGAHVAEVDHRYDLPPGYDPKANKDLPPAQAPRKLLTPDQMRAQDKKDKYRPGVYDETAKTGGITDASWASTQYTQLHMGAVSHELEIWDAAFIPWVKASDPKASAADKKNLPALTKDAIQHGDIALKKIDEGLKILDKRHSAVLNEEIVKNARDKVLVARAGLVVALDRVKRGGVDPRGEAAVANDLVNPVDPATQKGGWAPGAPK